MPIVPKELGDPEVGSHLELDVAAVIAEAAARPRRANMVIDDLSDEESKRFWAVLERL